MTLRSTNQFKVLLVLALLSGCGSGEDLPELYETSGKATTGGAPLKAAVIVMTPAAGGRPSYGEIDKDGNYKMQCKVDAPGATAGENIVSLMGSNPMPDDPEPTPERKAMFEKYAEGVSSMKITIDKDQTDLELKFD